MSDQFAFNDLSAHKDRYAGLIIFGVLQLLLACFFALMVPLIIFGAVVTANQGANSPGAMPLSSTIVGGLVYVLASAWFFTTGIGSILARRWARALILVSSWIWLVSGAGGFVFMLLFMPAMYKQMGSTGQMPEGALMVMMVVMFVFMSIFYIVVPGLFVLFYRSRHVKATCDTRDPRTRWTDRCPLPVLALCLLFAVWAVSMPLMGAYGWLFPFFGTILTGWQGAAICLALSAIAAYITWGAYRLKIGAWWSAIVVTCLLAISNGITFSRVSLLDFYERMNFPPQQLEILRQTGLSESSFFLWYIVLMLAGFLGYVLYTGKYFKQKVSTELG
jgi:MFS family permease